MDPLFQSGYVGFSAFGRISPDAPARRHRLLASRMEAAGVSKHTPGGNPPSQSGLESTLGLPDLDHSKAAGPDSLRSPESKHGYRHAMNSFSGIASSRDSHLTKLSPPVTGFSSKIATSQRERSTGDLRRASAGL